MDTVLYDASTPRRLVDSFITAYNAFDIDAMLALLQPDITFRNITDGRVDATASGLDEFRGLAEASASLFATRRQTIMDFSTDGEHASVDIVFEATLAANLPNDQGPGTPIRLIGRSEYVFRDGLIAELTDISGKPA